MTDTDNPSTHRKLALVIGNGNYKRPDNHLKHAVSNARKLSDLLATTDFDVTTYCDIDKDMMKNISNFADTITDGDLVLFYFSGHCCPVDGENYMIPTDDERIQNDRDVKDIGIRARNAFDRLAEKNKSYPTIFILDCCQKYRLKNESSQDLQDKGLKEMNPSDETFIQFACAANKTISDDQTTNHNKLFTKHLLRNIARENVSITDMFQHIVDEVSRESNGEQQPLSMNGLQQQHDQLCLYEMSDDMIINDCNTRIDESQLKLRVLTLKVPHSGDWYDRVFTRRMEKARENIRKLTVKRNRAIARRFSGYPVT